MNRRLASLVALVIVAVVAASADAGHELPFYPSFYPQEITVARVDPAAAATQLARSELHAYLGVDPFRGATPPPNVVPVTSLAAYVVADVDARAMPDRAARCAAATRLRGALASAAGSWAFHPYPVTPYHPDYLAHADLAEAARASAPRTASGPLGLRVRARTDLAQTLLGAPAVARDAPWDVTIDEVPIERLLDAERIGLDGWVGPPWVKAGWHHAYLLLASAIGDAATRRAVDALHDALAHDATGGIAQRLDRERRLVSSLTAGCERVVLGYTLRREYYDAEYSKGVENVARDSHDGLASPIFVRTVKLKDFPWNGWLRVGVETRATAAWNPVAGFTDPTGRFVWATLGDPAVIPSPHGGRWLTNRADAHPAPPSAAVSIPPDALLPQPGTGLLRPVGPGKRAARKIDFHVRASAFHDGTRMTVADALYPFVLAYRWGARPTGGTGDWDPTVAAWTTILRGALAAVRPVRVDTLVREYSDVKFVYDVPLIEVYLDRAGTDDELPAVAPPWSAAPWHVLVLAEEAARRGIGAFSERAATERGIAWLDLARDAGVDARLAAIVDELHAKAYVPPALERMVTAEQARERWAALKAFHAARGHFLVTNGPYLLKRWSPDETVLEVFRDLTYPVGVGSFDAYAVPLHAYATDVAARGDRLEVHADVERVSKFAREFEIVREPFTGTRGGPEGQVTPECRYVVLSGRGDVVRAGSAALRGKTTWVVPLHRLAPGTYTIRLALSVYDNTVDQPITTVRHTVTRR